MRSGERASTRRAARLSPPAGACASITRSTARAEAARTCTIHVTALQTGSVTVGPGPEAGRARTVAARAAPVIPAVGPPRGASRVTRSIHSSTPGRRPQPGRVTGACSRAFRACTCAANGARLARGDGCCEACGAGYEGSRGARAHPAPQPQRAPAVARQPSALGRGHVTRLHGASTEGRLAPQAVPDEVSPGRQGLGGLSSPQQAPGRGPLSTPREVLSRRSKT
jgi:hypothetical protein